MKLVAGAQPGQGQLRILAGGDHQVQLWWQVLEQEGEGFADWLGINHVVVVKDEGNIVWDGGELVEQGGQNRFGWWWLRRLEGIQHPRSNIRRNRLQRGDEMRQKACGVVIPLVQRQPGSGSVEF